MTGAQLAHGDDLTGVVDDCVYVGIKQSSVIRPRSNGETLNAAVCRALGELRSFASTLTASMLERSFSAMGTEIRVLIGVPLTKGAQDPALVAALIEARLRDFDRRLSRFQADSELCQINRDPRSEVPASSLLREAVRAGIWAAQRTAGLVDPTVLPQLEAAGYATSRVGLPSEPLADALAAAPPRRRARPNPRSRWRTIEVLDEAAAIRRPPGLMFDTGGVGKGLAADLVVGQLSDYSRYVIDVGGDVRIGGGDPSSEAVEVEVRHPCTGEAADSFQIESGAVATSGLDARLWRLGNGGHAHHLIDPASGKPAWTGLICASASAPTALEADTLAKAALLSGRDGARRLLSEHGGLIIDDDGRVERFDSV